MAASQPASVEGARTSESVSVSSVAVIREPERVTSSMMSITSVL